MTRQVKGARDEGIAKCEKCLRKATEKGFSRRKGSSECLICLPASVFLLIPLLDGSSCYSSPSGRISKENSFLIAIYTSRRVDPKFRLLSRLMTPLRKCLCNKAGLFSKAELLIPKKEFHECTEPLGKMFSITRNAAAALSFTANYFSQLL